MLLKGSQKHRLTLFPLEDYILSMPEMKGCQKMFNPLISTIFNSSRHFICWLPFHYAFKNSYCTNTSRKLLCFQVQLDLYAPKVFQVSHLAWNPSTEGFWEVWLVAWATETSLWQWESNPNIQRYCLFVAVYSLLTHTTCCMYLCSKNLIQLELWLTFALRLTL